MSLKEAVRVGHIETVTLAARLIPVAAQAVLGAVRPVQDIPTVHTQVVPGMGDIVPVTPLTVVCRMAPLTRGDIPHAVSGLPSRTVSNRPG